MTKKTLNYGIRTMKLLGIEMPLKEFEKIYNEFAKKMEELTSSENIKLEKTTST